MKWSDAIDLSAFGAASCRAGRPLPMSDEGLLTPFGFASASGIGVETAGALASFAAVAGLAVRRPEAADLGPRPTDTLDR